MPEEKLEHKSKKEEEPDFKADQEVYIPKINESGEIKTFLSWEAPSRPFRPKNRSYYTTVAILIILLVLIAFLAREFILIATLLAFMFVIYVLAFVPPHNVQYKISTQGIITGEKFYFWHELTAFWFKEKEGHKVLYIQTRLRFPGQLIIVLGKQNEEEVKKIIAHFLPFYEIPHKSMLEKWSETLQKHFPLENTHR